MHGLEQVGTDLSFGFLAIKWGFVSGENEAGLVGMHWVVWRVALMLKTELVLPIPCSLPRGECCPGVRLPPSGSSKLCAICQVLFSCLRGLHQAERWMLSFSLQAAGPLWSMVSMPSLPYQTLNWRWRARQRQQPWRTPGSGFVSLPWMLTGKEGTQAISAETPATCPPATTTPPLQSTPELAVC